MAENYIKGVNGDGPRHAEHKASHRNGDGAPGAEAIRAWLVDKLSAQLGIAAHEIDSAEPFASYGLGSTELVGLSGDLAQWLGRELPAELAYECPTIESLACHLAAPAEVPRIAATAEPERPAIAEPIAIIGIGCRFPGADNAHAFWQLLRDGVDTIREVPAERFNVNDYFASDPAAPGKMVTRWGGFIAQVDRFDAPFFGISPREASRMDPQQRLLLEVAAEALEDAGQPRERLAGSATGVFIGISNNDYGRLQLGDFKRIDAYAGTGNALSIAANRISYVFDLRGPSLAIDTACSSSLVAVHQACDSLRRGESALALAGGVNLILSPAITINFSKAGAMAPDGRCKSFDARADGYVRGEGAGVVVLKPLGRALADGAPIYAVIRGSAVNQDGRSNGLMAPNPRAQEAVLREAYRRAGVSPGDVQYVEAHGTGTLLGDPIEANALGAVLGIDRDPGRPCALGSVKTNIGHLEAAAGIAGLIKVALALKFRELPPSLNFLEPNPHIHFEKLPLRVQTTLAPWPATGAAALAGVSSFGFGGTNAHVVLQEAPSWTPDEIGATCGIENSRTETHGTYLLPLSARNPAALPELAGVYGRFLRGAESNASLHDICYSASVRRSHHEYRVAVTGRSVAELAESLEAYLRGEVRPGLSFGHQRSDGRRKLVFVFPGQGAQWFGMARGLLEREAVFREAVERCDRAMRPYGDWSLLAELTTVDTAASRINEIEVLQPALFAIQVALAALWRAWGIEPDAVVGHSMGEVAAAHVAGALSLDDAARIICRRSRLVKPAIGRGAMAAVELSLDEANRALAGFEDRVSIAASNSFASTVLSGEPAALEAILERLRRRDIFCRLLKVDFAAHSPQMDPLRDDLLSALDGLEPQPPSVPIYSTVTGTSPVTGAPAFDARYWARNLREPVLFAGAVDQLLEDGHDIFLEISPHPILLSSIQQAITHSGRAGAVLPSMRREEDQRTVMLASLGALYSLGREIDWSRRYPAAGRCVGLPSYPWQRERYWLEDAAVDGGAAASIPQHADQNAPLGRHLISAHPADTHFWQITISKSALPYLDHHRIEGVAVLPASIFLEMAWAAALEVFAVRSLVMNDIKFHKALFLSDGESRTVQVILSPGAGGTKHFHIYSCRAEAAQRGSGVTPADGRWTLHADGMVRAGQEGNCPAASDQSPPAKIGAESTEHLPGPDYYLRLRENGIQYGPFFQSITQLWRRGVEVLGELRIPDEAADGNGYPLHPAILDACIQLVGAAIPDTAAPGGDRAVYMPTHIDEIRIHHHPDLPRWSHAQLREHNSDRLEGEVRLLDEAGHAAVEMLGLRLDNLGSVGVVGEDPDDWLYEFAWQLKERADGPPAVEGTASTDGCDWLIFADSGGLAKALAAVIGAHGDGSVVVTRGESYARMDSGHYRVNPQRPEDLRRLLAEVLAPDRPRCRAVVHLWSLDAPLAQAATVASLETAQTLGCGSALQVVQELARIEGRDVPRLWLITRGAQPAGEGHLSLDAGQAPLWGLGRVIAEEHPTWWGGLIDLEPDNARSEETARQLWGQIAHPDEERQLAFRSGRRYVGRLVRKGRVATRAFSWRLDGTYLITGGLGDLGLAVARWMVDQGARRIILMGRTALPPRSQWNSAPAGSRQARQIAAIRALEALGASVHLAAVDVADEARLRAFLDDFRAAGWPPIRGVVHAAGVLQDGLLTQLDAAAMHSVMRPKVIGGWLLHRLLDGAPLDFFVLFSSAGSLLGQPGQGNYAAANAFLDALAHYRASRGQPALSVNWGAWSGLGFADSTGGKRLAARLAQAGIGSLAPGQALEILGRLIGQHATQVAAVPVNWARYRQFYPAGTASSLLSQLASARGDEAPWAGPVGGKRSALLAAEPTERRQLLQSHLAELVARVLGLSAAKLDVTQPLSNLGLDSLMAVELKNRIAVDLGVNVPMVTFLAGPSVEQAAAQLVDLLTTENVTSPSSRVAAITRHDRPRSHGGVDEPRLENLDEYTDEEVNSLLTDLMEKAEVSE